MIKNKTLSITSKEIYTALDTAYQAGERAGRIKMFVFLVSVVFLVYLFIKFNTIILAL